jgi:ABC-type glycerol-3-phosphate transport system permease component
VVQPARQLVESGAVGSVQAALIVVAIFEFVSKWNMFTEPLLYINSSTL